MRSHLSIASYVPLVILLLTLPLLSGAQRIKPLRQTLSVNGQSGIIQVKGRNYYVQQSVGQTSVIGTFGNNNLMLYQGFLQPPHRAPKGNKNVSLLKTIVFPNPFNHRITIEIADAVREYVYVTLIDVSGRVLFSAKYFEQTEITIDFSTLPSGFYILKVTNNHKQSSTKLVKH